MEANDSLSIGFFLDWKLVKNVSDWENEADSGGKANIWCQPSAQGLKHHILATAKCPSYGLVLSILPYQHPQAAFSSVSRLRTRRIELP